MNVASQARVQHGYFLLIQSDEQGLQTFTLLDPDSLAELFQVKDAPGQPTKLGAVIQKARALDAQKQSDALRAQADELDNAPTFGGEL